MKEGSYGGGGMALMDSGLAMDEEDFSSTSNAMPASAPPRFEAKEMAEQSGIQTLQLKSENLGKEDSISFKKEGKKAKQPSGPIQVSFSSNYLKFLIFKKKK